jgi:Leucine rich repeat variant
MTDNSQASVETRLTIASSNAATADELRSLAKDGDRAVRAAVAGNPNTPTEVLLKLGEEFPDEITANPIFNILLLEDPESQFVRLSLARSSTTSEETIARLAKIYDEKIFCAVARNLKTPIYILEQLAENPPQFDNEHWGDSDGSEYENLWGCIAKNPNTPASLLIKLAEKYSYYVKYRIAENPNAPINLLEHISDLPNTEIQKAVAKNPNTTVKILEKLAAYDSPQIRQAVSQHL